MKLIKQAKRVTLLFIVSIALCYSCTKDVLNPLPQNSLSDATAFSTPEKILAGVNNLYAQMLNASFYGGRFIIFQEQRGDEFSQNDGNNATGANVWNQTITSSGNFVNAVWTAAYRTINSANILLSNLQTTSVLSEALRKNYTGEAKLVRAFCYLSLVQTYARPYQQDKLKPALPLRLQGEISGEHNDMSFSTVEQVYQQIIKDLDEAETDLPESYSSASLNTSRASKGTAIALKTRAYLAMGAYDKVISEATKMVPSTAPYTYTAGTITNSLDPDLSKVFSGTYTGTEAILFLPIAGANEAPGNQSALAYNYLSPILYLNPSAIVSDPVFSNPSDARSKFIKKNASNQSLLSKFPKNSAPFVDYIPVIRYAEVLLNYAEAAAEEDDPLTAVDLLQAVRNRSDPSYTFPSGSISDKASLVATILKERRIELVGEGFRTMDLLRRVQTLPGKTGTAGTSPAITPDALNYVWAIPSEEISYNKLAPR